MPLNPIAPTPGRDVLGASPPRRRLGTTQIDSQRQIADMLAGQANNFGPAYGGTPEVLGRALAGLSSGMIANRAGRAEEDNARARQQAFAQFLGPNTGNPDANQAGYAALLDSGDPQLERMAFDMEMRRREAAGQPPDLQTIYQGSQVQQGYFDANGQFVVVGEGPRFAPTGGGQPRLPPTQTRIEGDEIVTYRIEPETGLEVILTRGPRWNPNANQPSAPGDRIVDETLESFGGMSGVFDQQRLDESINAANTVNQQLGVTGRYAPSPEDYAAALAGPMGMGTIRNQPIGDPSQLPVIRSEADAAGLTAGQQVRDTAGTVWRVRPDGRLEEVLSNGAGG